MSLRGTAVSGFLPGCLSFHRFKQRWVQNFPVRDMASFLSLPHWQHFMTAGELAVLAEDDGVPVVVAVVVVTD